MTALHSRQILTIPLTSICVPESRRKKANEAVVAMLVTSVERRGLLSPIRVTPPIGLHGAEDASNVSANPFDQSEPPRSLDSYDLVTGLHRLIAHERLGLSTIEVIVADGDAADIELGEIEENLVRRDLTVLERALLEKRRKELYLQAHPETRQGVAGGRARQGQQASHVSFAEAAGGPHGKRMVERRLQIAEALAPEVVAALVDTEIANNVKQLLELARLPAERRLSTANALKEGKAKTVSAAVGAATGVANLPNVPKDKEARAPLAPCSDCADGYQTEVYILGRRFAVHVPAGLTHVDLTDLGAGQPVPHYAGDDSPMEPEAFACVVMETFAELPEVLARDFTIERCSISPVDRAYVTLDLTVENRTGRLGVGGPRMIHIEVYWSLLSDPRPLAFGPMSKVDHLNASIAGRPTRGAMRRHVRDFLAREVLRHSHNVTRPVPLVATPTNDNSTPSAPSPNNEPTTSERLVSGLIKCGYTKRDAQAAVKKLGAAVETGDIADLMKQSLRLLAR